MKIIINPSHGCFGISEFAFFELIRRNAECLKSVSCSLSKFLDLIGEESETNFKDKLVLIRDNFYKHPTYEDHIIRNDAVYTKSEFAIDWRYDPTLISIVEEFGPLANGEAAHLKVVDIPDDVKFYIDYGDSGFESIHENHRVWY